MKVYYSPHKTLELILLVFSSTDLIDVFPIVPYVLTQPRVWRARMAINLQAVPSVKKYSSFLTRPWSFSTHFFEYILYYSIGFGVLVLLGILTIIWKKSKVKLSLVQQTTQSGHHGDQRPSLTVIHPGNHTTSIRSGSY